MGRVDAFSVAGLELWFNSSDHLPPHFHARRALEALQEGALRFRVELLEEWEAKVDTGESHDAR